jgi:hypothetical protein
MRATTRKSLPLSIVVAFVPAVLSAQGITVQTTSDVRLYGALGTMANIAAKFGGGDMHNIAGTTYLSGHKMRIDHGDNSTIFDADEGRVTTLDNKNKTYSTLTFAEAAAAMEAAARSAESQRAAQQGNYQGNSKVTNEKGEANFKYKLSVDKGGDRQKIAGLDADRNFITLSIEGEVTPDSTGKTEQVGTMVFLIDQWTSKDAPQAKAMREFQQAYAQKAGQAYRSSLDALNAAFGSDPRIKAGFDASAKEVQKIEGVPLRTTTYVVVVPPQMQFNRALALGQSTGNAQNADDKPKSGGFRGLMNRAKSAAEEASKSGKDTAKTAEPPKQTTIMSLTEEVKAITPGALAPDLFAAPAGYREVKARQP